ncbi:LacI family DNA-binding transcriptional regulator [Paenibacillus sp. GXUN7292]|uniref:LacI family DNA-binding transcriptional regulator n=1 Tax=Paenibacillus sp. GXUN7292 TaxID=3422499 RepID=UPI003D7DB7C5
MSTIRDVAKLAGVSVATVSRVLNKSGYVNKETERAVKEAIDLLQYVPNTVARGLAIKRMETIALVVPDISNPFFAELGRAAEDIARTYGYSIILCNSDNEMDKEQSYITMLKKRYVDGILFATSTLRTADVNMMNSANIPLVVLDRAPREGTCYVVRSKNYDGARLAVQHLLDEGCKKIAHIYGPQAAPTAMERLQGYEAIAKEQNWYSPSLMADGGFNIKGGMEAVAQLLERHPDIDGIFAGNDLMAVGALKQLQRMGKSIPDQIKLCGFDGIELSQITEPEITTIAQPIYNMGALATRLLIKKIEGVQIEEQNYEFDVELIVRGSTRRERGS